MFEAIILVATILLMQISGTMSTELSLLALVVLLMCIPLFRMFLAKAPPYVPTRHWRVQKMLELADVKKGERVYDLGCGDGRIVRAAAERGAIAEGCELSIPTFVVAKVLSIGKKNVTIKYEDFWKKDYKDADVIFCFLLKDLMVDFQEKIWSQLKPGARVVSHAFRMPGVKPEKEEHNLMMYKK